MQTPIFDLSLHGIDNPGTCLWNTKTTQLVEMALKRGEGSLARNGALSITRPPEGWPNLKPMVVASPECSDEVDWNLTNVPLSPELFSILYGRLLAFFQGRELFVQDREAGVHDNRKIRVRVISSTAQHALLAHLLLRSFSDSEDPFFPDFTIFIAPEFHVSPVVDQIPGPAASIIDLSKRVGLIVGTGDCSELTRMLFRLLSFTLPSQGRTPIWGTIIQSKVTEVVSLILGESASKRLTLALSASDELQDETDETKEVSFDGPISLRESGVDILGRGATSSIGVVDAALLYPFGTLIESTGLHPETRTLLEPETAIISWPALCLPRCSVRKVTKSPRQLVLAIRDDSGVLPPISKISQDSAAKIFALGPSISVIEEKPQPTAFQRPKITPHLRSDASEETSPGAPISLSDVEVAILEKKAASVPTHRVAVSFTPCFARDCLLRKPEIFARGLLERIERVGAECWVVNIGSVFRDEGVRVPINEKLLGRLLHGAITGAMDKATFRRDPILKCKIPVSCEGFGGRELDPISHLTDESASIRERFARELVDILACRGLDLKSIPVESESDDDASFEEDFFKGSATKGKAPSSPPSAKSDESTVVHSGDETVVGPIQTTQTRDEDEKTVILGG